MYLPNITPIGIRKISNTGLAIKAANKSHLNKLTNIVVTPQVGHLYPVIVCQKQGIPQLVYDTNIA